MSARSLESKIKKAKDNYVASQKTDRDRDRFRTQLLEAGIEDYTTFRQIDKLGIWPANFNQPNDPAFNFFGPDKKLLVPVGEPLDEDKKYDEEVVTREEEEMLTEKKKKGEEVRKRREKEEIKRKDNVKRIVASRREEPEDAHEEKKQIPYNEGKLLFRDKTQRIIYQDEDGKLTHDDGDGNWVEFEGKRDELIEEPRTGEESSLEEKSSEVERVRKEEKNLRPSNQNQVNINKPRTVHPSTKLSKTGNSFQKEIYDEDNIKRLKAICEEILEGKEADVGGGFSVHRDSKGRYQNHKGKGHHYQSHTMGGISIQKGNKHQSHTKGSLTLLEQDVPHYAKLNEALNEIGEWKKSLFYLFSNPALIEKQYQRVGEHILANIDSSKPTKASLVISLFALLNLFMLVLSTKTLNNSHLDVLEQAVIEANYFMGQLQIF